MNKESKEILVKAISDVGFWQWWDQVEGDYMVEFCGVLMYDDMPELSAEVSLAGNGALSLGAIQVLP